MARIHRSGPLRPRRHGHRIPARRPGRDRGPRAPARAPGQGVRDRRLGRRDRDHRARGPARVRQPRLRRHVRLRRSRRARRAPVHGARAGRPRPRRHSWPNSRSRSSATATGSATSSACGATGGPSRPRSRPRWCSTTTGRLLCTLLSVVDVTERRQTEEALKLSRGKLQEAIEFMPDATFIVDRDRQVVAWNRAMETLTGIRREDVMGTRDYGRAFVRFEGAFPILVDLLDLSTEELARTYPGVRRFGETLYFEAPVPSLRGGRGGHLWGKASPLSDRDGTEIGAIQTLRDISDWKRAEEAYRDGHAAETSSSGGSTGTVRGYPRGLTSARRTRRTAVLRRTFIYLYRLIVVAASSPRTPRCHFSVQTDPCGRRRDRARRGGARDRDRDLQAFRQRRPRGPRRPRGRPRHAL